MSQVAQLNIIRSGLKPHSKILVGFGRGFVMTKSAKEVMEIIEALTVRDYQAHHDRS